MSTRCQVVVKDKYESLWLCHHWDGYPEAMLPILNAFLDKVRDKTYRNNASQSIGWLIINNRPDYTYDFNRWQASEFEPCTPELYGDTKYLYTVDLEALEITYKEIKGED